MTTRCAPTLVRRPGSSWPGRPPTPTSMTPSRPCTSPTGSSKWPASRSTCRSTSCCRARCRPTNRVLSVVRGHVVHAHGRCRVGPGGGGGGGGGGEAQQGHVALLKRTEDLAKGGGQRQGALASADAIRRAPELPLEAEGEREPKLRGKQPEGPPPELQTYV